MRIGRKVRHVKNPKRIVKPIPVEIPQTAPNGIPVSIPIPEKVERPA